MKYIIRDELERLYIASRTTANKRATIGNATNNLSFNSLPSRGIEPQTGRKEEDYSIQGITYKTYNVTQSMFCKLSECT